MFFLEMSCIYIQQKDILKTLVIYFNISSSSTRTQSQLCTATPISCLVHWQISFRLLLSSVATFISIKIL